MFAEVEVACDLVDPEFWDQGLFVIGLLAAGGCAVLVGPGLIWHMVSFTRRNNTKGQTLDQVGQRLEEARGGASAPESATTAADRPRRLSGRMSKRVPASAQAPTADKRKNQRREGQPTPIHLSTNPGQGEPIRCLVTNRSRGGLGIVVGQRFAPGTAIHVRPADAPEDVAWIRLEVRTCRRKGGDRWYIGCRFTEQVSWTTVLLFG
jgi:hypothetical protein